MLASAGYYFFPRLPSWVLDSKQIFLLFRFFPARCYAVVKCLSADLSVTIMYCVKTAETIVEMIAPSFYF